MGAWDATGETAWNDGVKLGASALSFFDAEDADVDDEPGIASELASASGATLAGAGSLVPLALLDPEADPLELELAGSDFRSLIIFCRFDSASPPDADTESFLFC
jgi:hypothetical protein